MCFQTFTKVCILSCHSLLVYKCVRIYELYSLVSSLYPVLYFFSFPRMCLSVCVCVCIYSVFGVVCVLLCHSLPIFHIYHILHIRDSDWLRLYIMSHKPHILWARECVCVRESIYIHPSDWSQLCIFPYLPSHTSSSVCLCRNSAYFPIIISPYFFFCVFVLFVLTRASAVQTAAMMMNL